MAEESLRVTETSDIGRARLIGAAKSGPARSSRVGNPWGLSLLLGVMICLSGCQSAPEQAQPREPEMEAMAAPMAEADDTLRIAAFNIQVFGQTKAGRPEVMTVLARIAREFDVLVVQEVRDVSETVADTFLARINADPGPTYAMVEGPRLGRSNSKEQYVVYYVEDRVQLLDSSTYADPQDVFEREPLVATFQAGNFDFTLVVVHIKPEDAELELAALAGVADTLLQDNPDEGDVILLGDFNADCDYFDEDENNHPLRAAHFHWIIPDDADTTTKSTDCAYDRIILLDGTHGQEYHADSGTVFRFDLEYSLTDQDFVEDVSDHYPVVAEFGTAGTDDD